MKRRKFLRGALLGPVAFAAPVHADAPQTVSVVVDFSPNAADGATLPLADVLGPSPLAARPAAALPWEKWAGFVSQNDAGDDSRGESDTARALDTNPPGLLTARAVRIARTRHVGVALQNPSAQTAAVRLDTRLGSGLWRVEAVVLQAPTGDRVAPPDAGPGKPWRMESVLRASPGAVVKNIPLRAGQTVYLRFAETVREVEQALRAVQSHTSGVGVTTYSGESVPRALGRVEDIVSVLPVLIEKNNRAEIIKRAHRALLMVAQAEAMAQNAQQAQIDERDAAFDALTLALSEISCASWNLVPRQTVETVANGGASVLRVSVTNAGTRTLPLLSLAAEGVTGNEAKNARPVFRSIAPGATVSARFPLQDGDAQTARGIAQFIVDMGAARVYAQPTPDTALTPAAAPPL